MVTAETAILRTVLKREATPVSANQTVLLVEDQFLIALEIENSLSDIGFECVTASSLGQALMFIETGHPMLVILSCEVGGQSTEPIAEFLREKQIPFIVCSGRGMEGLSAIFSGAPLLPKPFHREELTETVKAVAQVH